MMDSLDSWREQTREALQEDSDLELSVVDLVLAVSELTEDETEVGDLVDEIASQSRIRLCGPPREPMAG